MTITILCPNLTCRKILAVPEKARSKKVRCKYCGTAFIVPAYKQSPPGQVEQAVHSGADSK